MSKAFAEKFKGKKWKREDVRSFTNYVTEPGPDGRPIYVTEQGHKDECDVNNIIKKYDATGLITHVARFEATYEDVAALDFRQALELQKSIQEKFSELPSSIRRRFENDPYKYLAFLENPANEKESVEIGLRAGPKPPRINQEAKKDAEAAPVPPKA